MGLFICDNLFESDHDLNALTKALEAEVNRDINLYMKLFYQMVSICIEGLYQFGPLHWWGSHNVVCGEVSAKSEDHPTRVYVENSITDLLFECSDEDLYYNLATGDQIYLLINITDRILTLLSTRFTDHAYKNMYADFKHVSIGTIHDVLVITHDDGIIVSYETEVEVIKELPRYPKLVEYELMAQEFVINNPLNLCDDRNELPHHGGDESDDSLVASFEFYTYVINHLDGYYDNNIHISDILGLPNNVGCDCQEKKHGECLMQPILHIHDHIREIMI